MSILNIVEAKKMLDANQAILLDIREQGELEAEGIAEPAEWLPLSSVKENESALDEHIKSWDKNKSVLIYCKSGGRAGRLVEVLTAKGVNAINVGGLKDWKAAGFRVKAFSAE